MSKIKYVILLLAASLFCIQCQNSGSSLKTESGYDYVKTFDGKGKKPVKGDFVFFEMDILDDQGKVLQSMRNLPQLPSLQIPEDGKGPNQPNPLVEMLSAGSVGDSLELIIPKDSMPSAGAQFGDVAHFVYKVNIKEIEDKNSYAEKMAKKQEEDRVKGEAARARESEVADFIKETLAKYKKGSLPGLQKLPSGLEYVIHEEGSGELTPVGDPIEAHYYGVVKDDGSMFDNSFSKGRTFSFTLGRGEVIKGWDEGMALIKKGGGKGTLFIPYEMAYGESGRPPRIPAKADLVFYVEIL